jgi:hypothetical protein
MADIASCVASERRVEIHLLSHLEKSINCIDIHKIFCGGGGYNGIIMVKYLIIIKPNIKI